MNKPAVLLLVFFSAARLIQAQQTIGGIQAPDAITLHIIKVTKIDELEQGTLESTWFRPAIQRTAKKFGTRLVAESDTARYTLSCIVHEGQTTSLGSTLPTWDGDPAWFKPECNEQFHAGDVVVFYSLDNLVWLSVTDSHGAVVTHGSCWKPSYGSAKNNPELWSFKCDTGMSAVTFGSTKGVSQVLWEKPYSIDSEESKGK